jgi:hypothetical protein
VLTGVIDFPSVAQLLAAVPVIAALAALLNVWVSTRSERRRSQPVVIAHEWGPRKSAKNPADYYFDTYLKNEGGGPAFNVRFGVELGGVRVPYRMKPKDPTASRQRVLASGASLPEPTTGDRASLYQGTPTFAVWVTWAELFGTSGDPDPGRAYWCRYENAFGHTWETRNPADRGGDLTIRRVRVPAWREQRDQQALRRLRRRGEERERRAVQGLRDGLEPPAQGDDQRAATDARPPDEPR